MSFVSSCRRVVVSSREWRLKWRSQCRVNESDVKPQRIFLEPWVILFLTSPATKILVSDWPVSRDFFWEVAARFSSVSHVSRDEDRYSCIFKCFTNLYTIMYPFMTRHREIYVGSPRYFPRAVRIFFPKTPPPAARYFSVERAQRPSHANQPASTNPCQRHDNVGSRQRFKHRHERRGSERHRRPPRGATERTCFP